MAYHYTEKMKKLMVVLILFIVKYTVAVAVVSVWVPHSPRHRQRRFETALYHLGLFSHH